MNTPERQEAPKPDIASELRRYLLRVLGVTTSIPRCSAQDIPKGLPIGTKNRYDYFQLVLYEQVLLLCHPKEDWDWTPQMILDDFIKMQEKGVIPVLFQTRLANPTRNRLIEYRVPFIDPGQQLHLPQLLVSLKERNIARPVNREKLPPVAQRILMIACQCHPLPTLQSDWLDWLGYNRMTLYRALKTLSDMGAVALTKDGRHTQISFCYSLEERFLLHKEKLIPPVTQTFMLGEFPGELQRYAVPTGYTALSHDTSIADNSTPTYGIDKMEYRKLRSIIEHCSITTPESATASLQIWQYPPLLPRPFKETGHVEREIDKLSLYLSLQKEAEYDERTAIALDSLYQQIWTKD